MTLSEAGEARIRGYLFMLESSLRTFLRKATVADAVREVESHIRERVRETEPLPNERDALNRLLDAIGPPHRLARAYAAELSVDEAVATGRVLPMARAVLALAFYTTEGLIAGVSLFVGYLVAIASLLVVVARVVTPDHVGVRWVNGEFRGAGWELFPEPGTVVTHGWWVAAASGMVGLLLLWLTHGATRRYLRRVSERRQRAAGVQGRSA